MVAIRCRRGSARLPPDSATRPKRHPLAAWGSIAIGLALAASWVHWSGEVSGLIAIGSLIEAATVFYLALFVPLAGLALLLGVVCAVPVLRIGRQPAIMALLGLTMGVAGICGGVALAWANADIAAHGFAVSGPVLLLGLVLTLMQTGAEELLFRGWLQGVLTRLAGAWPGIALSAAAFAAMHLAGGAVPPLALANLALAGVLFGLLARATGGLAAPIAAHFAWNAVEDLGFGLVPNPGIGPFGAVRDIDIAGPALWGGGEAGLNASIGTMAVLVVLIGVMVAAMRKRRSA